jgi:GTP-binding protein LepA
LVFDSVFDPYRGVVTYIKVVNGTIKPNTEFNLIYSEVYIKPPEVGHFAPKYVKDVQLEEGQI